MRGIRSSRKRLISAVIEAVEGRRLLSGAVFTTDTLAVTGTGAADTIAVAYTGGYAPDGVTPAFNVSAVVDGTTYTFTDVAMTTLTVDAGDGDDSVTVTGAESDGPAGSGLQQPTLAVSVDAGTGNDTVVLALNPGHDGPFTNAISDVDVDLGDGNDSFTEDINGELDVVGGPGNNLFHTNVKPDETTEATVVGGDGNDELDETGLSPFMTFLGGGGNNTLSADDFSRNIFVPGSGIDTYNLGYAGAQSPLSVTLPDGLENFSCTWPADVTIYGNSLDNHIAADCVAAAGTVQLFGQAGNDTLTATVPADGAASVYGGDGNDTIIGGTGGGSHFYSGGSGTDLVDYTAAPAGVAVYLDGSRPGGTDPTRPTDTFDGTVDNVLGSAYGDVIVGTRYDNVIHGNGGNDTILGNGGTDSLLGGEGNDILDATGGANDSVDGGDGIDVAYTGLRDRVAAVEFTQTAIPATVGGTAGSYLNLGNTVAKTSDGTLSTYFDAPTSNDDIVTDDFGSTFALSSIKFAPRAGFADRMTGGLFQGSNSANFSSVTTLYTITTAPAVDVYSTVTPLSAGPFRYVRFVAPPGSFGNVSEIAFYGTQSSAPTKFSGTVIGTAGSYKNVGNTTAKAFDGSFATFFDGPDASGDWVGLDLGTAKVVTQVKVAPRAGYEFRIKGGQIQASNSATFGTGVVTLATIGSTPVSGISTTLSLTNTTAYRYYRYLGPAGAFGNIAELEFDG